MHRRRRFLALAAALLSAGCASRGGDDGPGPSQRSQTATESTTATPTRGPTSVQSFVLWNDDDRAHRVALAVDGDGTTLLDTVRTVPAGETVRVDNPIERQGTYRVTASLDGGPERATTWNLTTCAEYEYQRVSVGPDGTLELQEKRSTVVPPPTCG